MLTTLLIFMYGLLIGSFLNALVWRLHEGKSIVKGRSLCPHCRQTLKASDLVPVVSWLLLRGRCRYCCKPISLQYPLVELATASLFTASYLLLPHQMATDWAGLAVWLYFLAILIALSAYDLKWLLLPDRLLIPAIVVAAARLLPFLGLVSYPLGYLLSAFAAGAGFYLLASLAGGRLMGGGDVKLATFIGLVLGPGRTLLALVLAFNLAAVVGVALILKGRKSRKSIMPFGPFLASGAIIAQLAGDSVISWYLEVSGLSGVL